MSRPVTAAAPAPAVPSKSASSAAPPPPAPPAGMETISLPLAPVIAGLPSELRAKTVSVPPPGQVIYLPVETAASQLAFGAVKITFGELRRLAPGIFGQASEEVENQLINLPLGEILPRLKPAHLQRRSTAKVQVSEEIAGPFGSRASGVTFTTQPLKAPAKTPPPEPPAPPIAAPSMAAPPAPPRPGAPVPVAATAPLPSVPPAPRPAGIQPQRPPMMAPPLQPVSSAPVAPAPVKLPAAPAPAMPKPVLPVQEPAPAAIKFPGAPAPMPPPPLVAKPASPAPAPAPIRLASAPAPVVPPAAAPVAPPPATPAQPPILVALGQLAELWPEELQHEIRANGLAQQKVPLAVAFLEAGLKRGRIKMTWRELRLLAHPGSAPSANDGLELELPLKVVAPLFLAAQKSLPPTQKKAMVSADIPNLFFGFPQPAAPAPEPAPAISPAGSPKPAPQTADSNFYSLSDLTAAPASPAPETLAPLASPQTDFTSRQAQPKEVVARAMGLPGVAGVVITLPDGLRVASEVPTGLNADSLAAFIPQVFERMNQSAKELRMGPLNNVGFTVGNIPWKIFRVNAVYLAAFGRAGETLPAGLAMLAGELDRKKQL